MNTGTKVSICLSNRLLVSRLNLFRR
jgi:hypothetical protein